MPTTATAKAPDKGRAPALRPFRAGAQSHDEVSLDWTGPLTAATQDLTPLPMPPAGFLRHIYLMVTATTADNAANTAFRSEGPWTIIDSVTFEDTNQAPIIGPFSGWELYLINKYGGYAFQSDPKQSPAYSVTTGAGATGGSFSFVLCVPIEIVERDTLGALPNKNANSTYKLRTRLAPSTNVYSTAPTVLPTVNVKGVQTSWWDPPETDLKGNALAQEPPAINTTQYWSQAIIDAGQGAFRKSFDRLGNPIRCLIIDLRDGTGARTTTDFPDPLNIQFEAVTLTTLPRLLWLHKMQQDYGYDAALNAAGGLDTGVFVLPFNKDFGLKPGGELRRGYLETGTGTRFEMYGNLGTSTATHSFRVLTNDVMPAGGNYASITA